MKFPSHPKTARIERIEDLDDSPWRLIDCTSGSQAYGTALPTSDVDRKGVFVLPPNQFYGLTLMPQLQDESHDSVMYELGRFVELLEKNNPNLMELLGMPPDCVRYRHPLFDHFPPALFLSKLSFPSFAGYAQAQIKRARGLNKKIVNPVEKKRKEVLDFCHVTGPAEGAGSVPVRDWLAREGVAAADCGLASVTHMPRLYALFVAPEVDKKLRGIATADGNDVRTSSIPKGLEPVGYLAFNHDAYKRHLREHREYWEWVEKRNDARYQGTVEHGKNYDAKNMMHTFRLLDMAEDIAREGVIRVRRPNRDELLAIRRGAFEYEDLVTRAESRLVTIKEAFDASPLPERPDHAAVERALVEVRTAFYAERATDSNRQ